MIFYTYDAWGNFSGAVEHVKFNRLPDRYTMTPPPDGDYPVWTGGEWELRDEPASPPAPPAPTRDEQEAARQAAYQLEADPLFFKWQRGTATEQEWLDMIAEIKLRYPYPEEA
jgi:hypothetical protein